MNAWNPADAVAGAGEGARSVAQHGWQDLQPLLNHTLFKVAGVTITPGDLIAGVVTVLIAWALSYTLRRVMLRFSERHPNADKASLYVVARLTHYAIMLLGFLLALDVAGIPIGKLAVFAGAIGVGLGFGLQAIFSNFVSGIILLFDRSLKVLDFVEVDSELRGTVRAIGIRATLITTNDNIDVIVPNSEFVTKRVVNWTHGSYIRRMRVPFAVAYGVDKELVKKAALEAAANVPFTLDTDESRKPQVWLTAFGDSSVQFVLAVWLTEQAARRNAASKAAYMWELDTALRRYGIEIPYPQRDLHVRSLFGLQGAAALAALHDATVPHADAAASEPAPVTLEPHERAELSRNDAQADTERQIAEDAARDAADTAARVADDGR